MSHLHRTYAGNAASVWELEGRWMREAGTFRPPAAVQWIATRSCDLTCSHCYSHAGPRHPDELSTAEALALVDAVADTGCKQLVIAGGEPLLRRDLDQVVARVHERGMIWALHTHGGLVPKRIALFERHPPSMVAVSLDGPEPLHDAIRGRSGAYRDALRALRMLAVETRVEHVVAGTVVNSRNADHLWDMVEDVRATGATSWGFHLFAPEGRGAAHTTLFPRPGQLQRAAALARRLREQLHVELDNEWGSAGALDPFYRDHPFLCGAGRFTCVVGVDGAILPCTTTDPAEAEGNIRTHDLQQVWLEGFGRFRGDGTDATCADGADCWLQTRNGHSAREGAFGVRPPERAVAADLPKRPRVTGALRWAAVAALTATTPAALAAPEAMVCAEDGGFPEDFDVRSWARAMGTEPRRGSWVHVRDALLDGRQHRAGELQPVVDVLVAPRRVDATTVLAALDVAEEQHVWDAWLVGALWRQAELASHTSETQALLSRLERHARVANALKLVSSDLGPVRYQPWMSKAARPPGHDPVTVPKGLVEQAAKRFASTDAGTWRSEVTLEVTVSNGAATLCRRGEKVRVEADGKLRLGRFDVVRLSEGATLRHADLGSVVGGSWAGPEHLARRGASSDVVDRIQAALASGSSRDVDRVAAILLVAGPSIRRMVADAPEAPGASAMRQLVALYDH